MSPRPNAPWPYYEDEPPTHRCPICDWLLEAVSVYARVAGRRARTRRVSR